MKTYDYEFEDGEIVQLTKNQINSIEQEKRMQKLRLEKSNIVKQLGLKEGMTINDVPRVKSMSELQFIEKLYSKSKFNSQERKIHALRLSRGVRKSNITKSTNPKLKKKINKNAARNRQK